MMNLKNATQLPAHLQPAVEPPPVVHQQQTPEMEKADEFRKYIETEVLNVIKDLAKQGTATEERIQQIAQTALDLIDVGMSMEELYRNAAKLDDNCSELAPVVIKIMREYEEKYSGKAVDDVAKLIRAGHYDAAQNMVKKVLLFKMGN